MAEKIEISLKPVGYFNHIGKYEVYQIMEIKLKNGSILKDINQNIFP